MAIDTVTFTLLTSVLSASNVRSLFKTIAEKRIAEKSALEKSSETAEEELGKLQDADLIGAGADGKRYFVTAKGLKVARDLEQIPTI